MSDEELRGLERAALEGGAADRVRLADALERAGRGSEALALLVEAIRESPADDDLRLGYARIVEARGDPRGAFIRFQVEAATLDELDPRRWELELRASALLVRWRSNWLAEFSAKPKQASAASRGEIPAVEGGRADDARFERGFLGRVTLTAGAFVKASGELFRREPAREVRIYPQSGESSLLAECPGLGWVRELDFGHATLAPRDVEALLRSPHLARLERIRVWANGSCDGHALAIARGPRLPNLRALEIGGPIGDDGARALAASPQLVGIERLKLFGEERLTDAGVVALLESPHVTRLTALEIHAERLGPEVARALARSGLALERLSLTAPESGKAWLGSEGIRALASWPGARRLRQLSLPNQRIGPEEARLVAESPDLGHLERLDLSGERLGRDEVEVLARAPHLQDTRLELDWHAIPAQGLVALLGRRRALESLTLVVRRLAESPTSDGALSVEEVARVLSEPGARHVRSLSILTRAALNADLGNVLATSEPLSGLARLQLYGTFGDDGVSGLARGRFGGLRHLVVSTQSCGPIGAKSLARSAFVGALQSLDLHGSSLRDEGTVALAAALSPSLLELNLASNGIDVTGIRALVESPAADSLVRLNLGGNPIGRAGVEALVRSPRWGGLRFLDLSQAGVDVAAAELLLSWPRLGDLAQLRLDHNNLLEHEDVWYDQGFPVGATPADPVVARIRTVLGKRLSINR